MPGALNHAGSRMRAKLNVLIWLGVGMILDVLFA
jgi:hypothetical protein